MKQQKKLLAHSFVYLFVLQVTSVAGVGLGTISQVVVGVDLGADRRPQGMVALLSLHSSRVTRVFHFTYKVRRKIEEHLL